MANFFINRPVFAWVIAILLMMAGALSIAKFIVTDSAAGLSRASEGRLPTPEKTKST